MTTASRRSSLLSYLMIAGVLGFILFQALAPEKPSLSIASGSENRALEPIIHQWADRNSVDIEIEYLGSVDIARALEDGKETPYDAVWPANSLWITLGDTQRVVTHGASILRSPVVLALRQSIAEDLGWIGRDDITIEMIAAAARENVFRLAMTSATQSNSGASAYLGFLYALSGNPDILTLKELADPETQRKVRDLLAQVDRSSGSSGWLMDALLANPLAYDAMFNYEAIALETNAALTETGREPLYLIYPATGLSVADSPLAFVSKGDTDKEAAFIDLQTYLLSSDVQQRLLRQGRRTGVLGMTARDAGPLWNSDWGADPTRPIAPIPIPAAEVIREALLLYQTELRKPSLTVWVLDVSGSMEGEPLAALKQAMSLLLDPEAAALNLLQPSARDITIILPFSNRAGEPFNIIGNDPADLAAGRREVEKLVADGGTDLYGAIWIAFNVISPYAEEGQLSDYLPAIVAMTDGASDQTNREGLFDHMRKLGFALDIPIHTIAFGQADEQQLEELNEATLGRLFTAGDDLAAALRSAKGYN